MNKNNPNVHEQDDELDLSSMINEYEEDSVLRQKIEQMKKQKAEEEARHKESMEVDASKSALHIDHAVPNASNVPSSNDRTVMNLPKYEEDSNKSTFLDVDATQDISETRELHLQGEHNDVDKTLVIMDNQRQRVFETQRDEEQEDESIFVYDNREVDEEEITDEDIDEFLGEEETKKTAKKQIDPKKMNKVITYVITGAVALCLLVGVGFGVKFAMDSFGGDDKASEMDTTKDKNKDTTKDTTKKDTDKDTDKTTEKTDPSDKTNNSNNTTNNTPTTDNSVKIAEINGTIKGYRDQIDQLNNQINDSKSKLNSLGYNEEDYVKAMTAKDNANNLVTTLTNELKPLQAECDRLTQTPEEGKDTAAQCKLATDKKAELDKANTALTEAGKLADDAVSKKNEYIKYTNEIANYNNQITDLNSKISDLQKQLSDLQ